MRWHSLSHARRMALIEEGLDPDYVEEVLRRTVEEDLDGGDDVTSLATIAHDHRVTSRLRSREEGVLAGLDVALGAFEIVCGADQLGVSIAQHDGASLSPGQLIATIEGPTQQLLTAERTALNLLCHLSGVATLTARWVAAMSGTGVGVRDTRKTTPGLRALEKYAVRCGGGHNHRFSLRDAALIKDNHVAGAGSITDAINLVRLHFPETVVEVEVDSYEQLRAALAAGADLILLDNMSPEQLREAVEIARAHEVVTGRDTVLEASGGLGLASARDVAETGVHFVAVGALTHSAPSLDLGLDF